MCTKKQIRCKFCFLRRHMTTRIARLPEIAWAAPNVRANETRSDVDWLVLILKWQIGLLVLQVCLGLAFHCPDLLSDSMYVALVLAILVFSCFTEMRKRASPPETIARWDILGILPTTLSLAVILWSNIFSMHGALVYNISPKKRSISTVMAAFYALSSISNFQLLRAFYATRPDDFLHKLMHPTRRYERSLTTAEGVPATLLNISFTLIQSFVDACHGMAIFVAWLSSWLHPVNAHYVNVTALGLTTLLAVCALFSVLWRNPHSTAAHNRMDFRARVVNLFSSWCPRIGQDCGNGGCGPVYDLVSDRNRVPPGAHIITTPEPLELTELTELLDV
eukprot:GEMP01008802.1.p1 GENE.GEMP01008802.1~~GEMP01008802.1.p1  ORF type:complete len:335 (-),score=45.42 GEMP01008802.1:2397-3401(-)